MRFLLYVLCLLFVCQSSNVMAQLVVFDNSHYTPGNPMYDDFRAQLTAWGYTVERRTTPLTDNGDADVILLLTEDGYTSWCTPYTSQEASWIKDFVDSGKGYMASVCPNDNYWANILEVMNVFGIADSDAHLDPIYYNQFVSHPLFDGVTELGDDVSNATSMVVSSPSIPVAGDGLHDCIAIYENDAGAGAAIWTSHYYMMDSGGLDDFDNRVFLENAFAWLSRGGVANKNSSWGDVKKLFD
ncbi:hypothetical protein KKG45_07415 [bacterium]|nr:hypothetical protein [bacterium]MBU1073060.1 hypothetical protein [bacterium]MBU1674419.1 hypothetical protein [bacterium]